MKIIYELGHIVAEERFTHGLETLAPMDMKQYLWLVDWDDYDLHTYLDKLGAWLWLVPHHDGFHFVNWEATY